MTTFFAILLLLELSLSAPVPQDLPLPAEVRERLQQRQSGSYPETRPGQMMNTHGKGKGFERLGKGSGKELLGQRNDDFMRDWGSDDSPLLEKLLEEIMHARLEGNYSDREDFFKRFGKEGRDRRGDDFENFRDETVPAHSEGNHSDGEEFFERFGKEGRGRHGDLFEKFRDEMMLARSEGNKSDGEEIFKRFGKMLEMTLSLSEGNSSDGEGFFTRFGRKVRNRHGDDSPWFDNLLEEIMLARAEGKNRSDLEDFFQRRRGDREFGLLFGRREFGSGDDDDEMRDQMRKRAEIFRQKSGGREFGSGGDDDEMRDQMRNRGEQFRQFRQRSEDMLERPPHPLDEMNDETREQLRQRMEDFRGNSGVGKGGGKGGGMPKPPPHAPLDAVDDEVREQMLRDRIDQFLQNLGGGRGGGQGGGMLEPPIHAPLNAMDVDSQSRREKMNQKMKDAWIARKGKAGQLHQKQPPLDDFLAQFFDDIGFDGSVLKRRAEKDKKLAQLRKKLQERWGEPSAAEPEEGGSDALALDQIEADLLGEIGSIIEAEEFGDTATLLAASALGQTAGTMPAAKAGALAEEIETDDAKSSNDNDADSNHTSGDSDHVSDDEDGDDKKGPGVPVIALGAGAILLLPISLGSVSIYRRSKARHAKSSGAESKAEQPSTPAAGGETPKEAISVTIADGASAPAPPQWAPVLMLSPH